MKPMKPILVLVLAAASFAASPTYNVVNTIKISDSSDPFSIDVANHRLYAGHFEGTEVIDIASGRRVGVIRTKYACGIAIAGDLGRGFISESVANDIVVFDLKTLMVLSRIKTDDGPCTLTYEPISKHVVTLYNTRTPATAFDARTGRAMTELGSSCVNMEVAPSYGLKGTIASTSRPAPCALSVGFQGKPSSAVADGKGHIYVSTNIDDPRAGAPASDTNIVEIDGQKMVSSRRYPIGGCHYAADLAIDTKNGRLYTSCFNDKRSGGTILASDFVSGRVLGTVTLSHVRFLVFDDGYAFSTGEDGTITVIGETSADKFEVVGTIETQANSSATELAVDPTTHKLYVCVGGPATKDKTGEEVRPWSVWIFGRQPAIP